jgi:hypothetical protein
MIAVSARFLGDSVKPKAMQGMRVEADMARASALLLAAACFGCAGAGAPVVAGPERYAVDVPAPGDEPPAASAEARREVVAPDCPPGSSRDEGQCVRLVPSPEIPPWKPSSGADPCATGTSEKGLIDCDPKNETVPEGDAGARAPRVRHEH